MHQILFPLGLHPRLRWRSLERFPRSLAVGLFKGAYASNGREGLEREEGKGRKGEWICQTNVKLLPTRLVTV